MKTVEKVLATALFTVGGLSLVACFGLAAIANYQLLLIALVILFVVLGVLSLSYGYVRRTNLQHSVIDPNDRNSPPGQFLLIGWSMLIVSIILLGVKLFWLH